ncbi:FtsK/SpoIIIE domain-containing protein [Phycicoccus duodecadis]|uniref:S-DNA-T family DNA segregation ATPase FtsK/SpoIIIE n=1 Tax=Phycicoccus duodecadis TaxID=173053 RepID=A0A2N3YJV3_9MICO|nr:FtsK/SpoIIIE domain-containing protein [Phycicoccus duodecadis]PKW27137.1 S-DNA-T family DNA segregation ATPase FtsK/SpoIIIE [Phycicoccus duodecadis]
MELRLTVHVPRRRPRPAEVIVSARPGATVADLRRALGEWLAMPVPGLVTGGVAVADSALVGMPPLLDGASVAVVPPGGDGGAGGAGARPRPLLELVTVGGPDAGRTWPLEAPGVVVGRAPDDGFRLADPSLSRRHARVTVDAGGLGVEDLGSTNGVLVDGRRAEGRVALDTSSVVVIGSTTLRVRRAPGARVALVHLGDGTALVTPSLAAPGPVAGADVEVPPSPADPPAPRLPWVAALVPLPVLAVMAYFLGPQLLAFAVLGPLAVLATHAVERRRARAERAAGSRRHTEATAAARARAAAVLDAERAARHRAHPDAAVVLARAESTLPGVWSGAAGRTLRAGLGDVPAHTRWVEAGVGTPLTAAAVPVVVDLGEHPGVGVVAPRDVAGPVLSWLVAQLLVGMPPSRLGLRGPATEGEGTPGWLSLVPHHGPGPGGLLVEPDLTSEGVERVQQHVAAGGVALVAATDRERLPDACRCVLEPVGGGRWVLRTDTTARAFVADGVGATWCDRLGRALAPLRETGGTGATLPRRVESADVGEAPGDPAGVLRRWEEDDGPRAVVGVGADGPFVVDLERDGPHVLVGGTTGSGKSEFLRTLVTGLALGSPPDRLTLLLVDFKGGSAFGPCTSLPHVVGVVTDLDAHLAERALRSLDAELRRRERLLATAGTSDLDAYRRRPGVEPLPRLVVVVDELRTLVDELPDLVRGLVRLAAQGRSLGIHLVLATQRPSGSLTPEIQANVNLRIAFRVRDRADSVSIVESDRAADLPADTPGRALARGGDGRLAEFQVALTRPAAGSGPAVTVRARHPEPSGEEGSGSALEGHDEPPSERSTEIAAVVDLVHRAHALTGHPHPRRPWLPALPPEVPQADVPPGTVALADVPADQCRRPLTFDLEVPLWRLVGGARTGRTTTLRALALAAAGAQPPGRLHLHAVAGTEFGHLSALPHTGTVVRHDDVAGVRALVEHLASWVRGHTSAGRRAEDGVPAVVLLVDGWERLAALDDPRDPSPLSEELLAVVRDGVAVGLVTAVTGGRELLRPRWALGGRTLLLGPTDPLDLALLGLPPAAGLSAPPPGRGLSADEGHEIQVVHARDDDVTRVAAATTRARPGPRPWRYRPLPSSVTRDQATERAPGGGPARGLRGEGGSRRALLVGVGGPEAGPWCWCPGRDGRRLLVAGRPGSGRSTALRVLARSARDAGRAVVLLVADRADPQADDVGLRVGPQDVDALVALRREHPGLVVLVDDADRLGDEPVLPVLAEIADLVDRDDGALVVATSSVALRTRFRGLDVDVARHGTGLLLAPQPADGELLGAPRLRAPAAGPPGRGVWVDPRGVSAVQLLSA